MGKLSAVVVVLNEEMNIVDCLESVDFADEIVVVDSHSVDSTVELAKRFTDKIYETDFQGYGKLKNYAISKATGEWVLSIDADERVTPALAEKIKQVVAHGGDFTGLQVRRRTFFLGRWMMHGGWYPGYVLRLFRRGSGKFTDALVHESVEVNGRVGRLKGEFLHYSDPDLKRYLRKMDHFTDLSAQVLFDSGSRASIADLILRPGLKFVKMYVLRRGFLDGVQGLILSLLSSVHVLFKYVKLWEKWRTARGE